MTKFNKTLGQLAYQEQLTKEYKNSIYEITLSHSNQGKENIKKLEKYLTIWKMLIGIDLNEFYSNLSIKKY